MTVRAEASEWLHRRLGPVAGPMYASRYYPPAESWTGSAAWWHEVPEAAWGGVDDGFVYLLCQKPWDERDFFCLKVPSRYFKDHAKDLSESETGFRLHLSADGSTRFRDERGEGKVPFAQFLIGEEP